MKNKLIYTLTTLTLLTGLIVTGCNSPSEKVENAKENVEKTNDALDAANKHYLEDYNIYKKETADKIAANEQGLIDFKARIEHEKLEAKTEYNEKISALEKKNSDMKKRLEDYKADSKDKWESFKTEFNHDLDELGKAFKDLTVNNVE